MPARTPGGPGHRPARTPRATLRPAPSGRAALLLCAGLVSAFASPGCAAPLPRDPATPGTPGSGRPHVATPAGREMPGTRVRVPGTVEAGGVIDGRAPPGSVVEAAGVRVPVGADGRFRLVAPASAGTVVVRIERPPPATALRMEVRVLAPAGADRPRPRR